MPLISFYYLIVVARTSNNTLNIRGKSGHPCLVPYFIRKSFSFSLLSIILAVGLSYMAFYYVEIHSFFTHFSKTFCLVDIEFCQMFFLPLLRWSCIFVFSFVYVVIDWFCICWTILVNFGWIPFGCGARSFLSVVGFSLLIFCSEFLYLHSSKILVYNFLFWLYLCLVLVSGW